MKTIPINTTTFENLDKFWKIGDVIRYEADSDINAASKILKGIRKNLDSAKKSGYPAPFNNTSWS